MRLRKKDNIADLDVKIQVIAQEILGLDRALADGVDVARHWLRFRQFHVLRPHRYDHLRVLVDALARMRLDLAHRRTHDTAPVAERGDRPSAETGAAGRPKAWWHRDLPDLRALRRAVLALPFRGYPSCATSVPRAGRRRSEIRSCAARWRRTGTPCRNCACWVQRRCPSPTNRPTDHQLRSRPRSASPAPQSSAASSSCRTPRVRAT